MTVCHWIGFTSFAGSIVHGLDDYMGNSARFCQQHTANRHGLPMYDWPGSTISFFKISATWLALFSRAALPKDANVSAEGEGFAGFTLSHNARTPEAVDRA